MQSINAKNKNLSKDKFNLQVAIDRDIIASSIVMIILCFGMTRGGFESFEISVPYLIAISAIIYILIRFKVSLGPYGLDLLPFAIFGFIIIPLQLIISDGYYNVGDAFESAVTYLMMILTIVVIVNKSNGIYLWRIVNVFSLIGSVLIIIQEAFFVTGIRLDQIEGMNETIFRAYQFQFFRPCGMFSEPSHFAQMGLISAFYYIFIRKDYLKLAIVGGALIISTSALGIVGIVLIAIFYSIHYIFSSSIGQLRKTIFILFLLIGGTFFTNWFFTTDNLVVLRILGGGTSSVRINRSFELFEILKPMEKIIGIGSQNQALYLNFHSILLPSDVAESLTHREFAQTFGYILCTLGVVGGLFFWMPFLKMFIKGNYVLKSIILLFGYICITSCINAGPSIVVYMILIYALYGTNALYYKNGI